MVNTNIALTILFIARESVTYAEGLESFAWRKCRESSIIILRNFRERKNEQLELVTELCEGSVAIHFENLAIRETVSTDALSVVVW